MNTHTAVFPDSNTLTQGGGNDTRRMW